MINDEWISHTTRDVWVDNIEKWVKKIKIYTFYTEIKNFFIIICRYLCTLHALSSINLSIIITPVSSINEQLIQNENIFSLDEYHALL